VERVGKIRGPGRPPARAAPEAAIAEDARDAPPAPDGPDRAARESWASWACAAVVLLASAAAQLVVLRNLPPIPKNDSVWYLAMSHAVACERVFDFFAPGEPTEFDVVYTAGYPLFFDAVLALAGWAHFASAVVWIQQAAALASVALLWRLGAALGRPGAGVAAAAAYAVYFPRAQYAQILISEAVFTLLALAAALAFVQAYRRPGVARLLGAGALVGLATAVRPLGLLAGAAWGGLLVLRGGLAPLLRRDFAALLPRLRHALVLGGLPALTLAGLLVHNHATYGRAVLSDASGRHLIDRVWAFDRVVARDAAATRRIFEHARASGYGFRIPGPWWDSYKALRHGSMLTAAEADALMLAAARESIAADPWGYVVGTGPALARLFTDADDWPPPLEQTLTAERFARYLEVWTRMPPEPRAVTRTVRAVEARRDFRARVAPSVPAGSDAGRWAIVRWRDLSPRYGAGLALAALAGGLVLLRRGRREDWVPALAVVAFALPAALLEYPHARYRQPIVPFLLVIAASGAWELWRLRPGARAPAAPDQA